MKRIEGRASTPVAAPAEKCFALLEAVGDYPAWTGELVPSVEVLEEDAHGRPTKARATIHIAQSPINRDLEVVLALSTEPISAVRLSRVPHGPSDPERLKIVWGVRPGRETTIELEFRATVSLPSLLPLPGVGNTVAQSLLGRAKRALEA